MSHSSSLKFSPNWLRWLLRLAMVLAVITVADSCYIRLAESGLGCQDWPHCYGQFSFDENAQGINVLGSQGQGASYRLARVTHRLVATALGLLVLGIFLLSWPTRWRIFPGRKVPFFLMLITVILASIGVIHPQQPLPLLTLANFVGGMLLVSLLWWLNLGFNSATTNATTNATTSAQGKNTPLPEYAVNTSLHPKHSLRSWGGSYARNRHPYLIRSWEGGILPFYPISKSVDVETAHYRFILIVVTLIILQILLGGWASANFAARGCESFLDCNLSSVASNEIWQAINSVGSLSIDASGRVLSGLAVQVIQWVHHVVAVFLLFFVAMLYQLISGHYQALRRTVFLLLAVYVSQFMVGMVALVSELPLMLMVVHNVLALILCVIVTTLLYQINQFANAPVTPRS